MKKRKTFIGMALVLAILILGVGYAAINTVNLTINGTANVTANADFKVAFDQNHEIAVDGGIDGANAAYTGELSGTMTVSLDSTHTTQSAIYKINNNSTELSATLVANVTNDDETLNKYVTVTTELFTDAQCVQTLNGTVAKGTSAYLKVTATLKNNPSQDIKDKTFTVLVTANPADAN